MKSNFLIKVLDRETVEFNVSAKEVLQKFDMQNIYCNAETVEGNQLEFWHNKKGEFRIFGVGSVIRKISGGFQYYLQGKVFSNGGKSVVEICHISNRIVAFTNIILGLIFVYCIYRATSISIGLYGFGVVDLIYFIGNLLYFASVIKIMITTKVNKAKNYKIMKDEAIRRIKEIENWDK